MSDISTDNGQERYVDLLHRAHEAGLSSLTSSLLQSPDDRNGQTAIVLAEAVLGDRRFSAIGDARASGEECREGSAISRAEHRAKCRTLADALGAPVPSVQEPAGPRVHSVPAPINARDGQTGDGDPAAPHADAQAPPGRREAPDKAREPATDNQLATIAKLRRLLGLESSTEAPLDTVQASACIADLARRFNEQGAVVTRHPRGS